MLIFLFTFIFCMAGFILTFLPEVIAWRVEQLNKLPVIKQSKEEFLQEQLFASKLENAELLKKLSGTVYR